LKDGGEVFGGGGGGGGFSEGGDRIALEKVGRETWIGRKGWDGMGWMDD